MIRTRPLPTFAAAPPAELRALRSTFDAAGYTAERAAATMAGAEAKPEAGRQLPILLRRTSGGRPLDTLLRVFVLGVAVPAGEAAAALGPAAPDEWVRLGLLQRDGDGLRATIQLRPYGEVLVASDFVQRPGGSLPGDHVMGVSPSTLALAGLTIRREGASVLDVGTGCGFQALEAVPQGGTVVGTDLNPRAVAFARLNSLLNDRPFEALLGDVFEPVAGRRFDLIVSNLPYVISPDYSHFFLHSGMEGDEICRRLAQEAPAHLTDGGYCQFLANWPMDGAGRWPERLAGWFDGTGCDVWVLRTDSFPAHEYAASWIEVDEQQEGAYAAAFDSWMRYFDDAGIERIGYGLVTMRPSADGRDRLFVDDGPEDLGIPCGDDIAAGLAVRCRLARASDDELLSWKTRLAEGVQLERRFGPGTAGWQELAIRLQRTSGLRYRGIIDGPGAELVGRCDGSRALGDLVAAMAAEVGEPVGDVAAEALPRLRTLLEQGFLRPAG